MMLIRLKQVPGTVTRARQRLKRTLSAMRGAMHEQLRREARAVLVERNRRCALATGQTLDAGHVLPGRLTAATFTTGVGIRRLPNGQEVRVERGDFEPHTQGHDYNGHRCSSGDISVGGTWDAPDERVNVRAGHPGVRVNPDAVISPLATAISTVHGDVAQTDARFDFETGKLNTFPPAQVKGEDKLRPRLKAAADGARR